MHNKKPLKSPSRASKMVYRAEWTNCPLGDSETSDVMFIDSDSDSDSDSDWIGLGANFA